MHEPTLPNGARDTSATLHVPIQGMTCQACAQKVERVLTKVPGIERAEVNYGSHSALLHLGGEPVDEGRLTRDLEAFYTAQ